MRNPPKQRAGKYGWDGFVQNQDAGEESFKLFFLAVGLVIMMIVWTMIVDIGGRSEREHPYPMPSTVQRLSPYEFVVSAGARTRAVDVCWGDGSQTAKRIERVHRFGNQTFVECGENQRFGVSPKLPVSKNYGQALGEMFTSLRFWGLALLGLLLALPWFCWSYKFRMWRFTRWQAKDEAKKLAQIEVNLEEQRLREVVAAFARCDIDVEEYDAGLQRAYLAGVPPATGE